MKKLFIIAMVACLSLGASAQILTSRTLANKKSNTTWFVRAGMALNGATNVEKSGMAVGYDLEIGFNKPISSSSVYWGMDLGVGTRGFSANDESALAHAVSFTPFTFGYKYSLTEELKLDGHFGGFASYDFAHNDYGDFDNKWDAGIQVGIGAWFKRFNLDFTYQRGFSRLGIVENKNGDWKDVHASTFLIRLGVAF